MNVIPEIVRLAEEGRAVRVGYQRPGEPAAAEYLVEPYGFHRSHAGPVLHAWQLEPARDGPDGWRDFRLDRITSVSDGGRSFEPRIPVTAGHDAPQPAGGGRSFTGFGDRPIAAMGDTEDYFRQIESAMLDGNITDAEMALAEGLGERVEIHQRKAAHARVLVSVLQEILQDGRISHREELYLRNVRTFLERLGWAP